MTKDESGEFLRFMVDNHGSASWAVRCEESQDDSPNVFRLSGSEHFDEKMRISDFLLMMLYIQASLGGLKFHGLHPNTMKLLRTLRNDWEPVVVHEKTLRVGSDPVFGFQPNPTDENAEAAHRATHLALTADPIGGTFC